LALVTDAGSPGISDPGERVVAACVAAGLRVEPIPGACAFIAALTASGLPTETFRFVGFPPVKSGQRTRRLKEWLAVPDTVVLYESPYRVEKLLVEIASLAPDRPVAVARELTKKFEEWLRGPAHLVAADLQRRPRKGEFVVMLSPAPKSQRGGEMPASMDESVDDVAEETDSTAEASEVSVPREP
jgi:16S rRNA (cytidine1402-2'-O)-methyltransferase